MSVIWSVVRRVCYAGLSVCAMTPLSASEALKFNFFGQKEEEQQVEILDPLTYSVSFTVTGDNENLADALRGASALEARSDDPASGTAGLLAAARGDYRRLLATLYNRGYYGGNISIKAAGREVQSIPLSERLSDPVSVAVVVEPGPRFRFGDVGFVNPPPRPADPRDEIGTEARSAFQRGEPAFATAVDRATDEAIEQWRELGHPLARRTEREIVANHADRTIAARVVLDPGAPARMARPRVEGPTRVNEGFIRYLAEIPESAAFDPRYLTRAETRLARIGAFRSVRIEEGEALNDAGQLPLTIAVQDRPLRRIGVGATLSTLDGLGVEAFWLHRNLFGHAERLRFDASINGIGETTEVDDYDYLLGVSYARPGVLQPDTTLQASLEVKQEVFDSYRERSVTADLGLERIVNENFTAGGGIRFSLSEIEDSTGTEEFETLSAPFYGVYDVRDSTVDPTKGYYLKAELEPFYELGFGTTGLRSVIEGRAYKALDEQANFVLAGRATFGTILGGPRDEVPTSLLFFSGGGGTVRGFEYRSLGIDIGGDTFGGRGLFELSTELRAKVTESIGLVGFADVGWVSEDAWAFDDDDPRMGVGLGLRYQTGLGPIRLDIATPIDRRSGESDVAVYIGIGQSF